MLIVNIGFYIFITLHSKATKKSRQLLIYKLGGKNGEDN